MRHPLRPPVRLAAALLCLAGAPCLALPALPSCVDPAQAAMVFERMAESDLKALYLACVRESSERRLSVEEAVHCSNAADVLKVRAFGGDFDAMIAWLRLQHDERIVNHREGRDDRRAGRAL